MNSRRINAAMVAAALVLSGCAIVPVDGFYYSSPPAATIYYGPPAVSYGWRGGVWAGPGHRHGGAYWSPGRQHRWQGAGPRPQWGSPQWGGHGWNRGGGQGWRPRGYGGGGGGWPGRR